MLGVMPLVNHLWKTAAPQPTSWKTQDIHSQIEHTTNMQEDPVPSLSYSHSCYIYVVDSLSSKTGISWQKPPGRVAGGTAPFNLTIIVIIIVNFSEMDYTFNVFLYFDVHKIIQKYIFIKYPFFSYIMWSTVLCKAFFFLKMLVTSTLSHVQPSTVKFDRFAVTVLIVHSNSGVYLQCYLCF